MRLVYLEDIENAISRNLGCGTNASSIIEDINIINPESLPIVKELREELEKYKHLDVTPEQIALLMRFFKERTSADYIASDMRLVADSLKKSKLEKHLESVQEERDKYKKYFDEATQDIANYIGLYKKMEDERNEVVELCAKLIVLCSPPKSWIPKLFRPLSKGIGDYMGSGYPFIDSFNKIITLFTENATDEVYKAVESAVKMESHMKYSETKE